MGHADSPRIALTRPHPLPTISPYDARMASIQKHRSGWRVQVYGNGSRDSQVGRTRQEAAQWALQREAELAGKRLPDKSFGDAMARYVTDVAPSHRGHRWETLRLNAMKQEAIAKLHLATLAG